LDTDAKFKLYQSMRLYFNNGGGSCWVISVGDYSEDPALGPFMAPLATKGILEKTPEPAIVCIPEAVQLSRAEHATLMNKAIDHCAKMQSRIVLVDVYDGHLPRSMDPSNDVISGTDGLRGQISAKRLDFAASYYPWLHTSVYDLDDLTPHSFSPSSKAQFKAALEKDAESDPMIPNLLVLAAVLGPPQAKSGEEDDSGNTAPPTTISPEDAHNMAIQFSPSYAAFFNTALGLLNEMPPSPAMAGVYSRTDTTQGVSTAPANTELASVMRPMVDITSSQQEDLNAPLDGKAVNAIRTFSGRGVMVWGARTMDANSQDWRYVSVRRTLIMLEQSIKMAAQSYVFAPNSPETCHTIKSMLTAFLKNQWYAGALQGATEDEAFAVNVTPGATQASNDNMGEINIVVHVAVARPTEFIIIQFTQVMQTS
jgi:hypothetical protein